MEIERNIELLRLQPSSQREVVDEAAHTSGARRDDDLVEMWIATDDRRGRRLDEVGEVSVGKPPAQRVDGRRREHDIADLAQPDEENSDVGYSSIVASSISITGMSSLIG